MDAVTAATFVISGVISIVCWVALWRGDDHVVSKVVWTLLAAVPVLGPLFFFAMHEQPPVQAEVDRASGGGWDFSPSDEPRDAGHGGHP